MTKSARFEPETPDPSFGVSSSESDANTADSLQSGTESFPTASALTAETIREADGEQKTAGSSGDSFSTPPRTVTRRESWRVPTVRQTSAAASDAVTESSDSNTGDAVSAVGAADIADGAADHETDPIGEKLQTRDPAFSESNPVSVAPDTAAPTDTPAVHREVPVPSAVQARARGELALLNPVVLQVESLSKTYGSVLAASDISFEVRAGSFTGVVGPNGAGKTTVLSMLSGLNRPSSGRATVNGIDVWTDGPAAKRIIGSLPDRLRLFDRLTGAQLLLYSGVLHGLPEATVASRAHELAAAFGLESALDRTVADYSAGMQKKIGLACALIHAPEILVLDEPFETIDPVSAVTVTEILEKFVADGGSVVMSSHSLELIQRVCDHVVVISEGNIAAQGTVHEVRDGKSLDQRFQELTNTPEAGKGLEWLHDSGASA